MQQTAKQHATAAAAEACCPSPEELVPRPTEAHVALFRALGDATRLRIVGLLAATARELCACEIESRFELSQPTISHHLRVLRRAGVVSAERRGTWVWYALDPGVRRRLKEFDALLRVRLR